MIFVSHKNTLMNRFPMEMHMVCINTKYINADGTLVGEYLENPDGVEVFGLMFEVVKRGMKKVYFFKTRYNEKFLDSFEK